MSILAMDIREVFGRNLRRFRTAADLSQEAIAVQIGADRAHVSSMERGQQNVTLITLWHVAEALGVRPMQLLDDAEAGALGAPAAGDPADSTD